MRAFLKAVHASTWSAIKIILLLVTALWLIELINGFLGHGLNIWGIYPRRIESLPGIFLWPLLHGGYVHLMMNTTPLLIMGFLVALRGIRSFVFSSLFILVTAGLGVWLFGREAFHVGASGLVFGYFGFLVALAWYERSLMTFLIAALMIFYYGGIIYGVLPQDNFVSWEGHLFGLLAGVMAANLFAKKSAQKSAKKPARKRT